MYTGFKVPANAASKSQVHRGKRGFPYRVLASKQAVFLERLERWLVSIDEQLEAARSGGNTVPEELLRRTGMIRLAFQDASGRLPIFLEFLIKIGPSPVVWQATVAPFRKYHSFCAEVAEGGIEEGSLRPVDPDLVSTVLVAFAVGILAVGLLDPYRAGWGQVVQERVRMLVDGLKQDRAESSGGGGP